MLRGRHEIIFFFGLGVRDRKNDEKGTYLLWYMSDAGRSVADRFCRNSLSDAGYWNVAIPKVNHARFRSRPFGFGLHESSILISFKRAATHVRPWNWTGQDQVNRVHFLKFIRCSYSGFWFFFMCFMLCCFVHSFVAFECLTLRRKLGSRLLVSDLRHNENLGD